MSSPHPPLPHSTVLVHLLGHHDLYVLLRDGTGKEKLARPSNVGMRDIARYVLDGLKSGSSMAVDGDRATLMPPVPLPLRGPDKDKLEDRSGKPPDMEWETAEIVAIRAPILEPTLTGFLQRHAGDGERALVLVSAGPVADAEKGARGSTHAVSELLAAWAKVRFPRLAAVNRVQHDTTRPFALEGTAKLVRDVDHLIRAARRPVADRLAARWKERFEVALSLSTGTNAVMTALLHGLDAHAPIQIHAPKARIWPENKGGPVAIEVQVHGAAEIRQKEALDPTELGPPEALAVTTMREWKEYFVKKRPIRAKGLEDEARAEGLDQETLFWWRKGTQEVLAVLVTGQGDDVKTHRGVNVEVSLPTGTLCAERNAIGSALAADPAMVRAEVRAVAVLSMTANGNPLGPCGACMEWLRKIAEVNPDFSIVTFPDQTCEKAYVEAVR